MCGVLVSEPVPTSVTVKVVGLVQPEETVVLPLRSGARPMMVSAGALPVPWYAMLIVKWVASVIENPVAVTLVTVLAAVKLVVEKSSLNQRGGPAPFRPGH